MSTAWNAAGDFADVVDATEAVTLQRGDGGLVSVASALRRRITHQEVAASGGTFTQQDVKWHLPQSEVDQPVEPGSLISDGQGRQWMVLKVDHDAHASRWRCWCRIVESALDAETPPQSAGDVPPFLAGRVEIQLATWTKGDQGAQQATWSLSKPNVPAQVQVVEEAWAAEHEGRFARTSYRVLLADDPRLTANHRLRRPHTGEILNVRRVEHPRDIDGLFVVHAETTPWELA